MLQALSYYKDIFISYSRKDIDFVRKLEESFQKAEKEVWVDYKNIPLTADWRHEMRAGIEASDNFVFIVSPNSVSSSACNEEIEYAIQCRKRLVPIICERPEDFNLIHAALRPLNPSRFDKNGFEVEFLSLLEALNTDLDHVKTHTRLLVRAIEWESKVRSYDLLLRGSELESAIQWLTQNAEKEPKITHSHREYINNSRKAEAARQEAEIERQKKARKQITSALIIAVSGFIVAAGLGLVAFEQYKKAEIRRKEAETIQESQINSLSNYSVALHNLGQDWQALIESLRALQPLTFIRTSIDTQIKVSAALQQALANVMERNQLNSHTDRVTSIYFSPDGKILASASADKTIKLWTLDGRELKSIKGHNGFILDIAFSPDGKILASASTDQTIKLWTLDGQELKSIKGHRDSVIGVSFSLDGKIIGTASADGTAKLWTLDGKEVQTFQHKGQVNSISFSPDNKMVITAGDDATAKLWKLNGQELNRFKGHKLGINSARFSPDGKIIITASDDKTVKLWDINGQELKLIHSIEHRAGIKNANFSPDGKVIVTASDDKTIKLWSLKGLPLKTLIGHTEGVISAVLSPDEHLIASASADKTIRLWQIEGEGLHAFRRHSNSINSVSFSPNGKIIATASADKTIKLWNLSGQELITLTGHTGSVNSVSFSPDGKIIATASADKTIKLWNLSGQELITLTGHTGSVNSVSFSLDGKIIATTSDDETIRLWDLNGRERKVLSEHAGSIFSVSFSPDGKTIITGSADGAVRLWTLSGQELKVFKGHAEDVFNVSFSPDGRLIASASKDGTVKLWNLNGQEMQTLRGHTDPITSISFSPDGKLIATASVDKKIKLWNWKGKELATLEGHTDGVYSVSFNPNSKKRVLISAGGDKIAILWNLDVSDLQLRSCDRIKQYLASHSNVIEEFKTCQKILTSNERALLTFAQGQELAIQGDIKDAIAKFQEARKLNPDLEFEPTILAKQLAASSLMAQGLKALQLGDAKQAIASYIKAETIDPTLKISASSWNDLCWDGNLNQLVADVLTACNKAVNLEPKNVLWQDTRGLARAKLGDFAGAIQDFQSFINWTKTDEALSTHEEADLERARSRRQDWIESLKVKKDPFTIEEIEFLANEQL